MSASYFIFNTELRNIKTIKNNKNNNIKERADEEEEEAGSLK
jgi:hypothetical protein